MTIESKQNKKIVNRAIFIFMIHLQMSLYIVFNLQLSHYDNIALSFETCKRKNMWEMNDELIILYGTNYEIFQNFEHQNPCHKRPGYFARKVGLIIDKDVENFSNCRGDEFGHSQAGSDL